MVIDNFNVVRIPIAPDEAQPPLVIDANAVLPGPVFEMNVESYRRRTAIARKPKAEQQPAEAPA